MSQTLKPEFVKVDPSSKRVHLILTIGADTVECNELTAMRLYEALKARFSLWGDKPNKADLRELADRIKAEAVLDEFMQRDAAQENPYSSPMTRDIPFGVAR